MESNFYIFENSPDQIWLKTADMGTQRRFWKQKDITSPTGNRALGTIRTDYWVFEPSTRYSGLVLGIWCIWVENRHISDRFHGPVETNEPVLKHISQPSSKAWRRRRRNGMRITRRRNRRSKWTRRRRVQVGGGGWKVGGGVVVVGESSFRLQLSRQPVCSVLF